MSVTDMGLLWEDAYKLRDDINYM